jgi:hypothetical protein
MNIHSYHELVQLTWDVREHYEEQKVMVAESEIQFVWHLQAPHLLAGYICLSCIQAEKFTRHTNRVQCNEECVPKNMKKF